MFNTIKPTNPKRDPIAVQNIIILPIEITVIAKNKTSEEASRPATVKTVKTSAERTKAS